MLFGSQLFFLDRFTKRKHCTDDNGLQHNMIIDQCIGHIACAHHPLPVTSPPRTIPPPHHPHWLFPPLPKKNYNNLTTLESFTPLYSRSNHAVHCFWWIGRKHLSLDTSLQWMLVPQWGPVWVFHCWGRCSAHQAPEQAHQSPLSPNQKRCFNWLASNEIYTSQTEHCTIDINARCLAVCVTECLLKALTKAQHLEAVPAQWQSAVSIQLSCPVSHQMIFTSPSPHQKKEKHCSHREEKKLRFRSTAQKNDSKIMCITNVFSCTIPLPTLGVSMPFEQRQNWS